MSYWRADPDSQDHCIRRDGKKVKCKVELSYEHGDIECQVCWAHDRTYRPPVEGNPPPPVVKTAV